MRVLAAVALLILVGLSGCIQENGPGGTPGEGGSGEEPELPERFFEPEVILETERLEVAKGSNPELTFYLTDLEDYPFPVTFIDWALFHDRNPNPVAEGDATKLPARFNTTLFAEDYHMFGFHVDDTQLIKHTQLLILQVGEPTTAPPNATEIDAFLTRIEEYFEEREEDTSPQAVCVAVCEGLKSTVSTVGSCSGGCIAAWEEGCVGWTEGMNGVDCAWMEVPEEAAGAPFSVTSTVTGDPDVRFLTSCVAEEAEAISSSANSGPESGNLPEGTRCIWAFEFTGGANEFTFEVKPLKVVPGS